MSIHDDIAKLPEWPKPMRGMPLESAADKLDATLARLRLAREWIGDMHQWGCAALKEDSEGWSGLSCDCGRDALLAALEEP